MPPVQDNWSILDSGSKTGWLFNYHPTTVALTDASMERQGNPVSRAALVLLFQDHEGEVFRVNLYYNPYILVSVVDGHEHEVELGLISLFGPQLIHHIETVEREDTDLINHLSGRQRLYQKVVFNNVQDLTTVRGRLEKIVKRNASMGSSNPLLNAFDGSLGDVMAKTFEDDTLCNTNNSSERWSEWVHELREYDVKYHMRVAIDLGVFVGLWYDVFVREGDAQVTRCDDNAYAPAMPRICAFDIETTKAPLKFPQPEVDQIYMISYMLDGRGYLIVNREIVADEINPFEYTPKPEYEGLFDTFNEPDEKLLLRRFYDEMRKYKPNVFVTYNGDYFDFPFIHARSIYHGMNMRDEIGFSQAADGAFLNQMIPHMDCFYWVKRDSYLPQGSQGLKAVTKYKLGYNPIEVDPEDMLPLAQTNPQQMASYSVSDAVATWYLYQKYVHPFIFSLSTIIPMSPDDVLRKGSGGLCESLLMKQAYSNNVVFPNKKVEQLEKFFNGHLIDTETYIGGRVEALRSGVFRSDIPLQFDNSPDRYQQLIDDLDSALRFALEVENGVQLSEVTNYEEVREVIKNKLEYLRDHPRHEDFPIIYHLDVGAMYPNIILTNRLQPYAIAKTDVCAGCCFNSPNNEFQCKRSMSWKWKAELLTAGRHEYQRVKAQLENESFAATVIQQADLSAVQKKTYGNRKGNVLEGTTFERKKTHFQRRDGTQTGGSSSGYRQQSNSQRQEAMNALLSKQFEDNATGGSGSDNDEQGGSGLKAYHKLQETTQFNMLKKRLAEYSRKAYGKIHESREIIRTDVVCQRENSFYVDTVRLFRDRRYEYKAALKKWKKRLDAATDSEEIKLCKSRCIQMESLQLAHKCILNSFYGYVMRKGSRWYSMEMAGIVTYLGASLIQMARTLVQQIGVTLELDTDGIWCCLPKTFPENFNFTTNNSSKPKVSISYPCIVLNKMVHDDYTNHQYQTCLAPGKYETHSECSIYFEVDGPYLAMLLPASREEGKSIKKRYAVFHPDGRLAELKGFELKRRGELMLIKDFQAQVFRRFLDGMSLVESYASAAVVADAALDMLYSKGEGYDTEEILEKLSESSNMTRRLSEYPDSQKSLALTTARRIAEFLGPQMVKDKGLACHFVLSRLPAGRPVTERPIPLVIFRADPAVRVHFLRKWTGDNSLPVDTDMRQLLDWDYYITRFNACVQKIITIPAALQQVPNPLPRVPHPDWLERRVQQQSSRFRQMNLRNMFVQAKANNEAAAAVTAVTEVRHTSLPDMEDLVSGEPSRTAQNERENINISDSDTDAASHQSLEDAEAEAKAVAERETMEAVDALRATFFTPRNTRSLDADFFAAPGFPHWLEQQKESWRHRAKLRREMLENDTPLLPESSSSLSPLPSSGLTSGGPFIDIRAKALSTVWHILEVREETGGDITVLAALDRTPYTLRCLVPRRILIETDVSSLSAFPNASLGGPRVLPRGVTAQRLLQIDLPPGITGERELLALRSGRETVRAIYESHRTLTEILITRVGCCAEVQTSTHLRGIRERPLAQRDAFALDELEASQTRNYLRDSAERCLFVFHVASETRGIVAVVNRQARTVAVVLVQAAAVPMPQIAWNQFFADAARSLGGKADVEDLQVTLTAAPDTVSAWRTVHRTLSEAMAANRPPLFTVIQSALSTTQLVAQRMIPPDLACLRVLGASEDERILTDPFRWQRLLARRMAQRYCASLLWVEERLAFCRATGIPLCNLAADAAAHAWDVLFSRSLQTRSHVLWDAAENAIALAPVVERPRRVVMPGGHTNWCVELSLARLDVVAVLFAQVIEEGDDPAAHTLCDGGISSHFNILRDLVADLLAKAASCTVADTLLANFPRWLRDPAASCHEPRLRQRVAGLAQRALAMVLLRLAKLGGRSVKVDEDAVVVRTPKQFLQEAVSFTRFMLDSLRDQPMLLLLALRPVRYWCPFAALDTRDYFGLTIDATEAVQVSSRDNPPGESLAVMQSLSIGGRLPRRVRTILGERMERTLRLAWAALFKDTQDEEQGDERRVNKSKMATDSGMLLGALVEGTLHAELIEEVHALAERRDLYEDDELPSGEAPPMSSGAIALEYAKVVCRLLDLLPSDGAVGRVRNNCLRLCGVSPFSPLAQLTQDPDTIARHLTVRCSFCNVDIFLDLGVAERRFRCDQCHAPISAAALESHLVRRVNSLVASHLQQDFYCSKCNEVAVGFMSQGCCGPIVGKGKSIVQELQALKKVAVTQSFAWLRESVETALQCA